jgi:G:T/U-mismatch repair DNA glycosylase
MTLKQKFFDIYTSYYKKSNELDKMVELADDYAIDFALFIDKKYYQHKYDNNKYAESEEDFTYGKTYNIKEILEIFKKEKEL